jgi:hypothetical protein
MSKKKIAEEEKPEYFDFLCSRWDVRKARQILQGRKARLYIGPEYGKGFFVRPEDREFTTEDGRKGYRCDGIRIDKDFALSDACDPTIPGICVTIETEVEGKVKKDYLLIDGWHRLYKVWYHQLSEGLPVLLLTSEESKQVRMI